MRCFSTADCCSRTRRPTLDVSAPFTLAGVQDDQDAASFATMIMRQAQQVPGSLSSGRSAGSLFLALASGSREALEFRLFTRANPVVTRNVASAPDRASNLAENPSLC